MRRKVGAWLLIVAVVIKTIVSILIFLSIASGIWWPIIKAIISSPVQALWLIPIGIFVSGIAAFIFHFIYDLLAMPVAILAAWLLESQQAEEDG